MCLACIYMAILWSAGSRCSHILSLASLSLPKSYVSCLSRAAYLSLLSLLLPFPFSLSLYLSPPPPPPCIDRLQLRKIRSKYIWSTFDDLLLVWNINELKLRRVANKYARHIHAHSYKLSNSSYRLHKNWILTNSLSIWCVSHAKLVLSKNQTEEIHNVCV